jgi:ketosteroid isomerase-like protein
MPSENVAAILRGYDALNRGDIDAVSMNLSPDFRFTLPALLPDVELEGHGPQEFEKTWTGWRDQFDDFRFEVEEAIDAGEGRVLVMAAACGTGKDSGAEVRTPSFAQIWTLAGGQAVSMVSLPNRATALGELGLGPKVPYD